MKVLITTLTIERLRAFRQLKLEGLGRVNLITGRNNTGKSSILEALRILTSDASPSVLSSILRYRDEDSGVSEETGRFVETESLAQLGSLFTGFPQVSEDREPIVLTANGGGRSMHLTISVGLFSEQREPDGTRRLIAHQGLLFPETELMPALVIESGAARRILPIDALSRSPRGRRLPAHRRVREWDAPHRSVGRVARNLPALQPAQRSGLRHLAQLGCSRGIPAGSPLFGHVKSSVAAIPVGERRFSQVAEPKAIIHTWLAWQKEPGKPLGTAITAKFLDANVAPVDVLVAWLKALFFP